MRRIDLNKVYDLRSIDWDIGINGSSQGILMKAVINNKKLFLKLSSYSKPHRFYGKEAEFELINSRIGGLLGLPVLDYDLKMARVVIDDTELTTLVSISKDFKVGRESMSIEKMYKNYSRGTENTIEFCKRMGVIEDIYKEFLYDYIICNLDRHGNNTEIIRDNTRYKLAPLFDNSLTFISTKLPAEITKELIFNDKSPVNNFIGDRNLLSNLLKIDMPIVIRDIHDSDRQLLFQGMQSSININRQFRDFIWLTLRRRIQNVKDLKIPFIQWR